MDSDFRQFYDLEGYLFGTVRKRFCQRGYLNAFDFFCIVIWKTRGRAQSMIAKRLLAHDGGFDSLSKAARLLTSQVSAAQSPKDKMRVLWEVWGFRLPTASAILTVFFPAEFTVYDERVSGQLGVRRLTNLGGYTKRDISFDTLWQRYREYISAVRRAGLRKASLRNKDRHLWGKSFYLELRKGIRTKFSKTGARE